MSLTILIKSCTNLSLFSKQHSFILKSRRRDRENARKRKRQDNLNTADQDIWSVNWRRKDKLETGDRLRVRGDDNTNGTLCSSSPIKWLMRKADTETWSHNVQSRVKRVVATRVTCCKRRDDPRWAPNRGLISSADRARWVDLTKIHEDLNFLLVGRPTGLRPAARISGFYMLAYERRERIR